MAWTLVTPSSRGIGYALTRQLLSTTPSNIPIVATTRGDKKETKERILSDLKLDHPDQNAERLDVQSCDLLSESSIEELAGYCKERYQTSPKSSSSDVPPHLRLAFLIPGMLNPERSPSQIAYELALDTLKLNLLAPMMLVKHFTPFLPRKSVSTSSLGEIAGLPAVAVMGLMSARVGSISDNSIGGWYSYRASKAGVTQLARTTDIHVRMQSGQNAAVVALHPGTVKTEFSREFWATVKKEKLFEPEYSAERLCAVVRDKVGADVEKGRGRFWDWKGEEVPP